jgi:hypothetical protein
LFLHVVKKNPVELAFLEGGWLSADGFSPDLLGVKLKAKEANHHGRDDKQSRESWSQSEHRLSYFGRKKKMGTLDYIFD